MWNYETKDKIYWSITAISGSLYFPSLGTLLGPRPWPGSPAMVLNLYLLALSHNLHLPAMALNLYLPALALNLYLPNLTETLQLPALVLKLYLPILTPAMGPNLYLPVQDKIVLLLPQLLVLSLPLPLLPRLILQLLLLPLLLITITRNAFAKAKSVLNGSYKVFDEKVKPCFSKFINIMANVFLIREAAFIFKEIGGWVFLKWIQIIAESIEMNKSRASWKSVCDGLSFGSFWGVSEPIRLATKKKL